MESFREANLQLHTTRERLRPVIGSRPQAHRNATLCAGQSRHGHQECSEAHEATEHGQGPWRWGTGNPCKVKEGHLPHVHVW